MKNGSRTFVGVGKYRASGCYFRGVRGGICPAEVDLVGIFFMSTD